MKAIHPRALLCPLQIALSVKLHLNYRSIYFNDIFSSLGFYSSYAEIIWFEIKQCNYASFGVVENTTLLIAVDNIDLHTFTVDGITTFMLCVWLLT